MNRIANLLHQYSGKLSEEKDSSYHKYSLVSRNTLNLNNPNISKKTKEVICHLEVFKTSAYYHLSVYEETYEIIGGMSSRYESESSVLDDVARYLNRYCFKKQEEEQISLF